MAEESSFFAETEKKLDNVVIVDKKVFAVSGENSQFLDWSDMGMKISIPSGALEPTESCEIATFAFVGGKFKFPPNTDLVSAAYAIAVSRPLLKPIQVEMEHCVRLTSDGQLKYLGIALASYKEVPYDFQVVGGGVFYVGKTHGIYSYDKDELHLIGILRIP